MKMTIEEKRQEILDILEYFKFETVFGNDIISVTVNSNVYTTCHINYQHGKHGGYFSILESENSNAYDFNLSGIRSDDFEKVKAAFWLYCKLVKEYVD
jgi:hypothetical protein